jgi:hypothetical protein
MVGPYVQIVVQNQRSFVDPARRFRQPTLAARRTKSVWRSLRATRTHAGFGVQALLVLEVLFCIHLFFN